MAALAFCGACGYCFGSTWQRWEDDFWAGVVTGLASADCSNLRRIVQKKTTELFLHVLTMRQECVAAIAADIAAGLPPLTLRFVNLATGMSFSDRLVWKRIRWAGRAPSAVLGLVAMQSRQQPV